MIRLSIIIPFYNVEQYIAQCLDSVYQQDISETEYEVICVNDASPDKSRDIVLEYQKQHPNLVLVEHEVNKKLGAARNTGRSIARGKYIWNVDSDDMIAPNCLKEMLTICETNKLDVLLFSFYKWREGKRYDREIQPWVESDEVYSGMTFWKQQAMKHQAEISPVWSQVYRKAYLDEKKIYSPEINMGEDVPYTYASILLADRMMACNKPYYIYRASDTSLTKDLRVKPSPQTIYENCFVCGKAMDGVYKQIPHYEGEIRKSVMRVTRYILLFYTRYLTLLDNTGKKELSRIMRHEMIRNGFVFRYLGMRYSLQYLSFVVGGKCPQYE